MNQPVQTERTSIPVAERYRRGIIRIVERTDERGARDFQLTLAAARGMDVVVRAEETPYKQHNEEATH